VQKSPHPERGARACINEAGEAIGVAAPRGQQLGLAVGVAQRNKNCEQQHCSEQNYGQRDSGGPGEPGTVESTPSGGAIGHRTLLLIDCAIAGPRQRAGIALDQGGGAALARSTVVLPLLLAGSAQI
jgi:hypothetical protein